MRDFGTHVLPIVTTLPGSGVTGQQVVFQNTVYQWHQGFAIWMPVQGYFDLVNGGDYTNASTVLSSAYQFAAAANASYELDLLGHWRGSATTVGLKLTLVTPTGALQQMNVAVSGSQSGVVTPTYLQLGVSGTTQNGPVAGVAGVGLQLEGRGLVKMGSTAGQIIIQAAATATGTVTIPIGTRLRYRRLV